MAYRTYQPDRRRRRRRLLLILLTTAVVIAAIAFLVSRQTEQRGTTAFFNAASEATSAQEQAAMLLADTLGRIGPLMSRQEVTRRLGEIETLTADAEALLAIDVPASIGVVYGNLSAASHSWVLGTADLHRVILAMIDGELDTAAEVQISAAFDKLGVGDVAYDLFLGSLTQLSEDIVVPAFPIVHFVESDPDDPALYDAQNLALRIAAAYNLTVQHDIGVVGIVQPEAVGDRGGIPLVPFADAIGVNAVVSNVGNEDESAIAVSLDVLNVDSGEAFTLDQTVDSLAAGASTTLSFADLDITPGGLYQVSLSVTIGGDIRNDNDAWTMTFIWNSET
jgi:hypothetical protein